MHNGSFASSIKSKRLIKHLKLNGQKFYTNSLIIIYNKNNPTDKSLLSYCLIVSKKVGNAVKRNRVKRVLRTLLRDRPFASDLLIIAKTSFLEKTFYEIKSELDFFFKKKIIPKNTL